MKIKGTNYTINTNSAGEFWCNLGLNHWIRAEDPQAIEAARKLYEMAKDGNACYTTDQIEELKEIIIATDSTPVRESLNKKDPDMAAKDVIRKIMDFFSEFSFEPNFRFINTLAFHNDSKETAIAYVSNYFDLIDSPYSSSVKEKMKSIEFDNVLRFLRKFAPKTRINKRFKLYYGSQGTGKTTKAMKEVDHVINCHSAMLPSDLMEDFDFTEGKAEFKPSTLYNAMVNGEKVLLDEINLLPFDSLRFLQSILDNKESFDYKGHKIIIKEGFEIIGTMNLIVGGSVFGLPDPLVDRAYDLKEYKLTEDDLVCALE